MAFQSALGRILLMNIVYRRCLGRLYIDMSGSTENPTPLSSTASSLSTEDAQTHRSPISSRDPIDASLVTLQAASLTLENAYRRIRAARRNLIDATRSAEEGRQALSGIGPGHEAITLVGGNENENSTVDSASETGRRVSPATSVAQSRARFQAVQEQLRQIETTIDAEIRSRTILYGEPVSSSAVASPPRSVSSSTHSNSNMGTIGSQRPNLGSLRTTNLDGADGSTSLGRRVALREMTSNVTSPSSSTSSASLWLEQTLGALTQRAETSREMLDSMRRQMNSRGDLPPQSPTTSSAPSSGVESTQETRRRSMYVARSSTRSDTSTSSVADSRRRRLYGTGTGTTSSSLSQSPLTSESDPRLSLLSNFSVQNLPTPVSGSSPRALIFEEPTSYVPAANFIEPTSNTRNEPPIRESQDERSYVVRRRYNANGEEFVHSINMEWADDDDDDPMAWMLSRESQEDLGLDVVNTRVGGPRPRRRHVNHPNPVGRRRTWGKYCRTLLPVLSHAYRYHP